MKKQHLLFFIFFSSFMYSQVSVSAGKYRIGGAVGVNFGSNNYFNITVSPSIGREIAKNFVVGANVGYTYTTNNLASSNLFTVGPFANYFIMNSFYVRGIYDYITGSVNDKSTSISRNIDENALWLGAGLYQSAGNIIYYFGADWNILFNEDKSVFNNAFRPVMGIYFAF